MSIKVLNDPNGRATQCLTHLHNSRSVHFVLCIASTHTSDREGISAAGASPEERRLTPAFDAEALVRGHKIGRLPVSPEGIVSPVVITHTCLNLIGAKITVVNCGAFVPPNIEAINAGDLVAQCLSTGQALPASHVKKLFDSGVELGETLSPGSDLMVIAECVPGGTSTALAVLTGLGYHVSGLVSSSMQHVNHQARWQLVQAGLERSGLASIIKGGEPNATLAALGTPLNVVAAVGDPMQPVAAGLALQASKTLPVVLAGGSQMLAVYALAAALGCASERLTVITTPWVAFDKNARVPAISEQVGAPFACSILDLNLSQHAGLRAYEAGHVKEGIGSGAAIGLARIVGKVSELELIAAIDEAYNRMFIGKADVMQEHGCSSN